MLIKNSNYLVPLLQALKQRDYTYTCISPASHEKVNNRPGNELASDLAGMLGWSRPFNIEAADPEIFQLMQAANILSGEQDYWRSQLRVSSIGALHFLHSAYPTDQQDAVFFGPDTYRFAQAIQGYVGSHGNTLKRAVDIGTGSGVGAILLAKACPQAEVFGVDINEFALTLARANAEAAEVAHIQWINSDLLSKVDGEFDLIIANPPYLVDQSARSYRHGGGPLGAELAMKIVATAIERLAPQGCLLLYTGVAIVDGEDLFRHEVATQLESAGFNMQYQEIDPDIFGEELLNEVYEHTDRIAAVVLTAQKP